MSTKADYVRSQGQTRDHHCHWPGCERQVPPARWGCRAHWALIPKELQRRIWQTFRPGQEKTLTPSRAYLEAADDVQRWCRQYIAEHPPKTPPAPKSPAQGSLL